MEQRIIALIEEAGERSKIVPEAEAVYERLLGALEKAMNVAAEWDREMRRAGLNVTPAA